VRGQFVNGVKNGRWEKIWMDGAFGGLEMKRLRSGENIQVPVIAGRLEMWFVNGRKEGAWIWFDAQNQIRRRIEFHEDQEVTWSGSAYDEEIAETRKANCTVVVRIKGDPGTALKAGRVIATKKYPSGPTFSSIVPIAVGKTGVVETIFVADDQQGCFASPGTLTQIRTPVSGWLSVTNPKPAEPPAQR